MKRKNLKNVLLSRLLIKNISLYKFLSSWLQAKSMPHLKLIIEILLFCININKILFIIFYFLHLIIFISKSLKLNFYYNTSKIFFLLYLLKNLMDKVCSPMDKN